MNLPENIKITKAQFTFSLPSERGTFIATICSDSEIGNTITFSPDSDADIDFESANELERIVSFITSASREIEAHNESMKP